MERNDRGVVCSTIWYLPGSKICCPFARLISTRRAVNDEIQTHAALLAGEH
jgi:hypothetical protein